jgi:uncharacterized hydrophobic protein (TIGR00271 family)
MLSWIGNRRLIIATMQVLAIWRDSSDLVRRARGRKDAAMMTVPPDDAPPRQTRLQQWLKIDHHSKPLVYAQVYEAADLYNLNYWLEIVFSAGIAALGLVLNSPAVIIGAMLISPLMGPIMATGLALAAGDLYLAIKAIAKLVASIAIAIALSAFIVWLLPFHSTTAEVLSRINPDLLDLGVALFSGLAGSVAVCRAGNASAVTTLPGVAIAVALMPPLCVMGYGLGSGMDMRIMGGAGLLFLTNLVAIVSSAFVVFLLVGMNSPNLRSEMELSRRDGLFATKLMQGPLVRVLSKGGKLHWRILMLAVLLAAIAVPLRTALKQVAGEAIVRGAVQDVVKGLLPPETLVSQQLEVGRDSVAVRLITTRSVPDGKLQDAEREIERRSGRKAEISVSSVASQSELAQLMQRLAAPPPSRPAVESLQDVQQKLIQRVTPVLDSIWPPQAPMQDFDLAFAPSGMVLNVRYQSVRELDKISLDMVQRECRLQLGVPDLSLNAQRVSPPRRAVTHANLKP